MSTMLISWRILFHGKKKNYGNDPYFVELEILPQTTTLVALTYGNKHFSHCNMKLQQTNFGGY
jgi:hypothetical protein